MGPFLLAVVLLSVARVSSQVQNDNHNGFTEIEAVIREYASEILPMEEGSDVNGACSCSKDSCGCCTRLKIKKLHLDSNACVNVTYLPNEIGFQLSVSIGGKVVFQKKISAKNPPPVCFGVPKFKAASLCVQFYNLSTEGKSVKGCIKIEAKLLKKVIQKIDLGCFKIPPAAEDSMLEIDELETEAVIREFTSDILPIEEDSDVNGACKCSKDSCGCCTRLKIKKLHLDSNACVNVTYLPNEIGFQLSVSIGDKVVFQKKISAKNPPPVCFGVPMVKAATLCVQFYNLATQGKSVKGCIKIEAKLAKISVKKIDLGCFKIPPAAEDSMLEIDELGMETMVREYVSEILTEEVGLDVNGACSCSSDSCGCCVPLKIKKIHLDSKACVKVTYLSSETAFQLSVTIGSIEVFKKKIPAKNPSPVCFNIPKFRSASMCIQFYNLSIQGKSVKGCIKLQAKLAKVTVKKIDLGCFKIPAAEDSMLDTDDLGNTNIQSLLLLMSRLHQSVKSYEKIIFN